MQRQPLITQSVKTRQRSEMIEVTDRIAKIVREGQIEDGIAIVCVPHTTAAVTINENADPDVKHDLLKKLELLIPKHEGYYQHNEGNSDSHLKTALTGNSVTVIIDHGRLVLGTWQGIYLCEFDGPREREMHIKIIEG
ncbi:MAG TPA: secondary thiamine-phosphate synthase enzyme YjbQ [Tepidisphaeraceae bacterium]|jgi:secondary thiamine-phosphate synthase enzyme|nr:secondary thiamine-phosphate synthase enzyme YjbQ [Tepidisphaeraceae bacterium]